MMDEHGNPSARELLDIIERARADRVRREAMDRYWQLVCETLPKPSEWPCTADRRCMASHHEPSCPIRIAEMIRRKK